MDAEDTPENDNAEWSDWREGDPDEAADDEPRGIKDFVRRAVLTGIGAAFVTEEAARSAIGDIKLPKEAMAYIASQADRTKRDIVQTLAKELRLFLDGLEVEDLITKTLSGATFEINTTVRIIPKESGGLAMERVKSNKDNAAQEPAATDHPAAEKKAAHAKKTKRTRRKKSAKSEPSPS